MKVPLLWLREFIALPTTDPQALAGAMNMLGHEVEGYETLEPGWSGVMVGKVIEVSAHPSADKVRVCQVDVGSAVEQIICGAWNFGAGAHVAVALPGAVLPGGLEIGRREIRGVMSNGMICSERELGLGDDQTGILVLDGTPEPGRDFTELVELPDVVFDLSITPNRGDAMSILGIARDLAAHYGVTYAVPPRELTTVDGATSISVDIEDPSRCWRFTGREIRGVTIGPSPLWMRHRLTKAGMRPITNVVDVTNYVMLELGHPLHAFDARSIDGDHLSIRLAASGETLVTLDGVERKLTGDDLIIYDRSGPTSMAGTMGGERSEVSSATTDVLMEAAMWDPPTIMYMSRRHDLRSEASTRFERGVDPALSEVANSRASALVVELAGGGALSGGIDEVARPHVDSSIELRLRDVSRVLGTGFDSGTVADALGRLGMMVSGDDPLTVVVPSHRVDVTRPVDLVEEVARIHGYDAFEPTLRLGSAGGLTPVQARERLLYTTVARAGLDQAVTLPFVGEPDLVALGLTDEIPHLVRVRNPLRDEESRLRPTLLPGLLASLRHNISHGNQDVALFESGTVFRAEPDGFDPRLPKQTQRVAWAIAGSFGPLIVGEERAGADADVSLALVRLVGTVLGLGIELRQGKSPGYHPGRTAKVVVGSAVVGFAGELDPAAARHFEIRGRVGVAELDLDALTAVPGLVESVAPSVFPFIDFDLSFVVPDELPIGRVRDALLSAGGELVESCDVFDVFHDSSLDEGTHAVALRCRLRASDRTLTNDEMRPVREAMIDAAGSLGARLRGA